MSRPPSESLTPLELEIMKVLWKCGPSTVQTVQQALEPKRPLAYTSVQTMLNVLERKGKAKRTKKDRAHLYSAQVTRESTVGRTLDDLIERLFGGSAESLVMSLLESRKLSRKKLAELEELVRRKREGEEP
jgi:predicted transcriptional regulator